MPPFVSFPVELRRELPVGFRRYDRSDAAILQVFAQPIRIEGSVGQQMPGGQVADQSTSLAQVVGLPRHQTEIDKIAERVRQCQYASISATSSTFIITRAVSKPSVA